jgi:hypothetical protein
VFTDDQISQAEQLYAITLSDGEWTLLQTPDPLLGHRDSQRLYILAMALQPSRCPACGYILCQRSACTQAWNPDTSTPDDAYACPNCKAGLTWHLGMIGGAQWFSLTATEPQGRGPCICEGRGGHTNPECPWYGTDQDPPRPTRSGATVTQALGRVQRQPEDDRAPVYVVFTHASGSEASTQLLPGRDYLIRHTVPGMRADRQSRMGFVGRGGGMLLFDARPAAGTQQLRDDQVRDVEPVGKDPLGRYVSRPLRNTGGAQ